MRWKTRLIGSIVLALSMIAPAFASDGMEFHLKQQCSQSGCSPVLLAQGPIIRGSYDKLLAHLREIGYPPPTVAFSSPGGNLGQAMKMGVLIRALGVSTQVPSGADCLSACVYAFMGGVSRSVDPGSRVGVHQFTPESEDIQVSVEDTLEVIEGVSLYSQAMGVSEHLSGLALMAPPDQINLLTYDQVRLLRLDNMQFELSRVQLHEEDMQLMVSGKDMTTDRTGSILFAQSSVPGHLRVEVFFREPGLYPRLIMEKMMVSSSKMMLCPAPDLQISPASQCLFVPAELDFMKVEEGAYLASFTVDASQVAALVGNASHIALSAGPDGHPPLLSLVAPARGIPHVLRELGSQ